MRDFTRYELTLKNSSNPASRKNVMTSSTGTTPTKTYERMSLRRTRHSNRRLAQNAKRVDPIGAGEQQREAADHVDGLERRRQRRRPPASSVQRQRLDDQSDEQRAAGERAEQPSPPHAAHAMARGRSEAAGGQERPCGA